MAVQGIAIDLPVYLVIYRHDGVVKARVSITVRIPHLPAVPAVVQETACVRLVNKPIHGGEDVAASGEERASGVAVVRQHYHGPRVGRVGLFSQEGEHIVHILVAALKLMRGAGVICSTHKSSVEGQRGCGGERTDADK